MCCLPCCASAACCSLPAAPPMLCICCLLPAACCLLLHQGCGLLPRCRHAAGCSGEVQAHALWSLCQPGPGQGASVQVLSPAACRAGALLCICSACRHPCRRLVGRCRVCQQCVCRDSSDLVKASVCWPCMTSARRHRGSKESSQTAAWWLAQAVAGWPYAMSGSGCGRGVCPPRWVPMVQPRHGEWILTCVHYQQSRMMHWAGLYVPGHVWAVRAWTCVGCTCLDMCGLAIAGHGWEWLRSLREHAVGWQVCVRALCY
jgi:hypothetical protein